ncbi:MAG: homocysteine biosynthesis protein [Planctomycetota bacterium]|nr:homocysteine biosynthesis protein [Planctomycetota bacterium]
MPKTYKEINEKIRKGQAVVLTADEMVDFVAMKGAATAAKEVDVVTTGTFGPMCSSGAWLNIGHTTPRMKIQKAWLNNIPVYCGVAAVDMYVGATELPEDDPMNRVFPGEFKYGGGHLIEDLIKGKDVELRAIAHGTDCYPRKEVHSHLRLKDCNEALLCNPRNAYQNYNVAVNAHSSRTIYTYLGVLRPGMANANYCSAGQLSPLLKDPFFKTIGIGTRVFVGGAFGYIWWHGTQHNPNVPRTDKGVPRGGSGTIAVVGNLKEMSPEFLRGASFRGYGVTLAVGIGIPIPILDEEIARYAGVSDAEIFAPIVDYSQDYPAGRKSELGEVSYKELKSGQITVKGRQVETAPISSYHRARQIATTLKEVIVKGEFLLSEPAALLPTAGSPATCKPFVERPLNR